MPSKLQTAKIKRTITYSASLIFPDLIIHSIISRIEIHDFSSVGMILNGSHRSSNL